MINVTRKNISNTAIPSFSTDLIVSLGLGISNT